MNKKLRTKQKLNKIKEKKKSEKKSYKIKNNLQNWRLIWSDEFDGISLDSTSWTHDIGTGSQYGLLGWGNSELQYYQPQNTEVNSGSVKIIAKVAPAGIVDSWGNTMYYSSSKITTKEKFDFRYGKVEARIKTVDGEGFWPAFWMLPTGGSWPCDGEIDIMEQWGNDGPSNITTGAAHVGTCPGSSNYQSSSNVISSGSYADNFHLYSIHWQPDYITWYVDNVQFHQVTPSSYPNNIWPFNSNNWYLMFNLAITSSGPNSKTVFPSQIEIDYVRIYKNIGEVSGCTDSTAINYNPNAEVDNGTCNYNTNFNVTFQLDMNNVHTDSFTTPEVNGTFNDWCGSCASMTDVNGDNIWDITISLPPGDYEYKFSSDSWNIQEDLSNADSCVVSEFGYTNRFIEIASDTIVGVVCWGSCSVCDISGCTDSTAINYDSLATFDDGTCTFDPSICTNPSPSNVNITELIHDRVTVNWDNMNDANCMVNKYRIRYRETGTTIWSSKTMSNSGLGIFGLNTESKRIFGLTSSTTYEFYMKAWYYGGGVSSWSDLQNFTTLDNCPNVGNFAVTTPIPTKATFTWDNINGPYSFVRMKARVDSISIPSPSDFFSIGGAGVNYGTYTKNKNGLVPGETYRGQARTWCDSTGGPYRAPSWTSFIYWTQPTAIKKKDA